MSRYASTTSVPVERSRVEIEHVLTKYGASHFAYANQAEGSSIGFQYKGRRVRFDLPMPTAKGRTEQQIAQLWRQRWRVLLICIKSKLECVECGITTFEKEFLAHIVLPTGQTVGDWMIPQVQIAYENREMPKLLEM